METLWLLWRGAAGAAQHPDRCRHRARLLLRRGCGFRLRRDPRTQPPLRETDRFLTETEHIRQTVRDAQTAFVLQAGLAPNIVNVVACRLFQEFCRHFVVKKVERPKMPVGALTDHVHAPTSAASIGFRTGWTLNT